MGVPGTEYGGKSIGRRGDWYLPQQTSETDFDRGMAASALQENWDRVEAIENDGERPLACFA